MAGAGYKLFNTGDVLTAAQVNTYLNEQTVMVFANAAARTSALTSVLAEGMVSYLQDTNNIEVYNGSAWVGFTGDITEVQAGTGISVASGTGPVPTVSINTAVTADLTSSQTLTNKTLTSPVLTTPSISNIDAKGDLLVGTADNTIARLAVGTNDFVLTAASGETTGLKWAAAASGNKTISLIASGSLSGASVTLSSLSTYDYLQLRINGVTHTSTSQDLCRINNNSTAGNYLGTGYVQSGSTTGGWTYSDSGIYFNYEAAIPTSSPANSFTIVFENCKQAGFTTWRATSRYKNSSAANVLEQKEGVYIVAEAVSSLVLLGGSNYSAGNYELWGG